MKSTILLTTALFLASAPSPDAKTISELSAGFLSVDNDYGLMASEAILSDSFDPRNSAQLESLAIADTYKPTDHPVVYIIEPAEKHITASQEHSRIN